MNPEPRKFYFTRAQYDPQRAHSLVTTHSSTHNLPMYPEISAGYTHCFRTSQIPMHPLDSISVGLFHAVHHRDRAGSVCSNRRVIHRGICLCSHTVECYKV